jgi:hypothetical protein
VILQASYVQIWRNLSFNKLTKFYGKNLSSSCSKLAIQLSSPDRGIGKIPYARVKQSREWNRSKTWLPKKVSAIERIEKLVSPFDTGLRTLKATRPCLQTSTLIQGFKAGTGSLAANFWHASVHFYVLDCAVSSILELIHLYFFQRIGPVRWWKAASTTRTRTRNIYIREPSIGT